MTQPQVVFANENIMVFARNVAADQIAAPDGYDRADDNPYVFVRHLAECSFRTVEETVSSCCGKKKLWKCSRFDRRTTRRQCAECHESDGKGGVNDHV